FINSVDAGVCSLIASNRWRSDSCCDCQHPKELPQLDKTRSMRRRNILGRFIAAFFSLAFSSTVFAADLKPKTTEAFDKYVAATEARQKNELAANGPFLYVEALPANAQKDAFDRLKNGEVLVEKRRTKAAGVDGDVPSGLVHHWV